MKRLTYAIALLFLISTAVVSNEYAEKMQSSLVLAEDITWGYLNPLRGDKSPAAAELWGDRTQNIATGMLVKFNSGFSSPPHIHNISYRGIVIDGLIHNDDPTAQEMWMSQGSFWTQPAGESHITAASGYSNLIYLEIDKGPYLVAPSTNAFASGEASINIHRSNLTWLNASDMNFINTKDNVEFSALWGSTQVGQLGGSIVKIPAGFTGYLDVDANEFKAVIIQGKVGYESAENSPQKALSLGSYFDSTGKFEHKITILEDTLIYIRTNGIYRISKP